MGSQSVTNFPLLKMNQIQSLVKDYAPRRADSEMRAMKIGEAAVGTLRAATAAVEELANKEKGQAGKGSGAGGAIKTKAQPTSDFMQTLMSRSVEQGLGLILTLIEQMKKSPQRVYEESGAAHGRYPIARMGAFLRDAHSGLLTQAQTMTESAFAANEALPKTLFDIVSRKFPREKELVDLDTKKLTRAFKGISANEIVTIYLENVAAGLINLVLDASRGEIPPPRLEHVKQSVRDQFIPKLIAKVKRERKKQK
jgi:hypothetical protein